MLALTRNVAARLTSCFCLLAALLFAGSAARAAGLPQGVLTGRVHDPADSPLPGVVVTVKGSGKSAITNATGYFVLDCDEAAPTLVLNCAGYHAQTVQAQGKTPLDIVLYKAGAPMPAPLAMATALEAAKNPVATPDEEPAFPGRVAGSRATLAPA